MDNQKTYRTHYSWRSDPSHAWLEVPLHEIKQLNILNNFSSCSYICEMRGYAYLECDGDAALFLEHRQLGHNLQGDSITFEDIQWPEHGSHWIRRLDSISTIQHNKEEQDLHYPKHERSD
jgi:hypothetical protein